MDFVDYNRMSTGIISVLSRKEAYIKGVLLERPEKHEILQLIEERTTIKNGKSNNLIQYNELISHLSEKYRESSIKKTIIELKLDNLIILLPGLTFDETTRQVVPHIYFIAKPEKRSYDVHEVYNEVVNSSVDAVNSYILKGYVFNRDEFWKDLESSMMDDEGAEIYYPNIYFSPDILFEYPGIEFKTEPEIYDQFKNDLMKSLVASRRAVWIGDHRVFLVSEQFVDELSQTLKSFFYNRILSQYEIIPQVARECDVIKLQEEIYSIEADNKKTMSFIKSRTYPVEKYLTTEKYGQVRPYPGKIVITLIQELEKFINEAYEKKDIAKIYQKYEELKFAVKRKEQRSYPLYYLFEEEMKTFPVESLEKIKNEKNLLQTSWETPDGTVQIFMEINSDNFNLALDYLKEVPEKRYWEVLAFRKLLQDSRRITPEINPFQEKAFYNSYGELLNNAYLRILPFYFNILMAIQIGFIRNMVYKSIKKFIDSQQTEYGRKNQKRRDEKKREIIARVSEKKIDLNKLVIRNRILEELDFFYFKQNLIPNIREIRERFPDIKPQVFNQIIDEFSFTLVKVDGQDMGEQNILFYPKTKSWSYTIEKTKKQISDLQKMENNLKKSNSEDKVLGHRIQALNMGLNLT